MGRESGASAASGAPDIIMCQPAVAFVGAR